jgi:hypothetical protein
MNCRYSRRWPRVAGERDRRAGLIEASAPYLLTLEGKPLFNFIGNRVRL